MKYISKSQEPLEFAEWKNANPYAKYKDLARAFRPQTRMVKDNLRQFLKTEQHSLCCYCECRLVNNDFHIEHFKPKDANLFPELQLEYSNLYACCHAQPSGDDKESCGHRKGNFYSPDLVSPSESDCATHFSYLWDGAIAGTDNRGNLSIGVLNLNSQQLKESRKALLDFFIEDVPKEMLSEAVINHLDVSKAEHGEYFSMVQQLLGDK